MRGRQSVLRNRSVLAKERMVSEIHLIALPAGADCFLRRRQVLAMIGLSATALYRRIAERTFPPPFKVGEGAARWSLREVVEWQRRERERDMRSARQQHLSAS